ncbi:MAG TPA: hypothetical protein ENH41_05885 [Candidatus Omnitrophica bacterium]|nr:hypothetical protein [Candidatus Omnitrophota bacterium]
MIRVDFYEAIGLYLSFLIIVSLLYFVLVEGRNTSKKKMSIDERHLWQCAICMHAYVDLKEEVFSNCPRCGSINQKDGDILS